MRNILLFIAILFICCAAADISDLIEAPGSAGMNSRIDVDQVGKNESRYSENVNISEHPGKIVKRNPYISFGDNNAISYGAYGYINPIWDYNIILGVSDNINSVKARVDLTASPDTLMYYTFPTDTAINNISVSADGGSGIQDSALLNSFLGGGNYDFCDFNDFVIISDGENIPYVFVPRDDSMTSLSAAGLWDGDIEYYRPRVSSIGMEAPGQLKVNPVHSTEGTERSGLYRYTYLYDSSGSAPTAIPSRWVELNSQNCMLSLFEGFPSNGANDTTTFIIWRQKYTELWYAIDTFVTTADAAGYPIHYVDSLADGTGTSLGSYPTLLYRNSTRYNSSSKIPGAFYRSGFADTVSYAEPYSLASHAYGDSLYYVAYSYYDPITGIESPLGPLTFGKLIDSADEPDSVLAYAFIKAITSELERSRWIRCYRSKMMLSANSQPIKQPDEVVMYGMYQLRANEMYSANVTASGWDYLWWPGWVSDDSLANGVDTVDAYDLVIHRNYDILRDDDGEVVIRPPFISSCEIPFSDVEEANYRLWGIGDPLYPSRLYYSEFNQIYDWSPVNYLEFGKDKLVALKKLPYGDAEVLLVFGYNTVYIIGGEDVEYDASVNVLTSKCGAVSRRTVISTEDEIFFMSPNMKIYSTKGGVPEIISNTIENYIDTIFTNYDSAKINARTFRTTDKIIFFALDEKKGLAFDLLSRTWDIETYSDSMLPVGSFRHDTTSQTGYSELDYWIFQADSDTILGVPYGKRFIRDAPEAEADTYHTSAGASSHVVPFAYQTKFYGDGQWLYEIQKLQFTAKGDSLRYVYLTVYDENEDSLLVDSVLFLSSQMQNYTTAFKFHQGKRLSVRFWTKVPVGKFTRVFELSDIKVDLRKLGEDATN